VDKVVKVPPVVAVVVPAQPMTRIRSSSPTVVGGGSYAAQATVDPASTDCSDLGHNSGEGDFIRKFDLQ
jgi:hypothetical protein